MFFSTFSLSKVIAFQAVYTFFWDTLYVRYKVNIVVIKSEEYSDGESFTNTEFKRGLSSTIEGGYCLLLCRCDSTNTACRCVCLIELANKWKNHLRSSRISAVCRWIPEFYGQIRIWQLKLRSCYRFTNYVAIQSLQILGHAGYSQELAFF